MLNTSKSIATILFVLFSISGCKYFSPSKVSSGDEVYSDAKETLDPELSKYEYCQTNPFYGGNVIGKNLLATYPNRETDLSVFKSEEEKMRTNLMNQ